MANYLLVYHGGGRPQSPEDQATSMRAWTEWFGLLGGAVVDRGNPAGQTKRIGSTGSVADDAGGPSGYSIIKADSIDQAVSLAKGCPVLAGGGQLQVVETLELATDASGPVQSETEQRMLDDLGARVNEIVARLGSGEVLVVENEQGHDYPKPRQQTKNVVVEGENRLHFEYTMEPPLRVTVRRPAG